MLPWSEKHRPGSLAEVGGNEDVLTALRSFRTIADLPHLILHGPPGSGKTSSVLAMARSFFGEGSVSTMLLELNSGDVRGVETMRSQIQCFTRCSSVTETASTAIKMVVLDEADGLTHRAQCALRHLMETFNGNVRFCLCCNYVNKLSSGLRSRCTVFRFSGLRREQLHRILSSVVKKESVHVSSAGLNAIVDVCAGDARQAMNLLQSLNLGGAEFTTESVYDSCGLPSPSQMDALLRTLLTGEFSASHESLSFLVNDTQYSLVQIISLLADKMIVGNHSNRLGRILSALAAVERCLLQGGSESIAIGAVIGAFHLR